MAGLLKSSRVNVCPRNLREDAAWNKSSVKQAFKDMTKADLIIFIEYINPNEKFKRVFGNFLNILDLSIGKATNAVLELFQQQTYKESGMSNAIALTSNSYVIFGRSEEDIQKRYQRWLAVCDTLKGAEERSELIVTHIYIKYSGTLIRVSTVEAAMLLEGGLGGVNKWDTVLGVKTNTEGVVGSLLNSFKFISGSILNNLKMRKE
jgi:hypothetical protein